MALSDQLRNGLSSVQNQLGLGNWRSKLQVASFRGVAFLFDSHEFTGGRRQVTHEYPEKNEPFTEDLGRRSRVFTLSGHVLGNDYFSDRDALISALEANGSGQLVHPYFGKREVFCDEFRVRETQGEGRIARFDMTFREAGSADFPQAKKSPVLGALAKVQEVANVVADAFALAYQVSQLPGDLANAAKQKVGAFTASVQSSLNGITKNAGPAASLTSSINTLNSSLTGVLSNPVFNPTSLASSVQSILLRINGTGLEDDEAVASTKLEALTVYESLVTFDDDDPTIPLDTDTRILEKQSRDAFNLLVQATAATHMVAAVLGASENGEFVSFEEAETQRLLVSDFIDEILDRDIDDDVYKSLTDLRAELIESLPLPPDLPKLRTFQLEQTMPALVVAYRLYGDSTRDQEIIDRNNIANPAAVPGMVPLEVLSE